MSVYKEEQRSATFRKRGRGGYIDRKSNCSWVLPLGPQMSGLRVMKRGALKVKKTGFRGPGVQWTGLTSAGPHGQRFPADLIGGRNLVVNEKLLMLGGRCMSPRKTQADDEPQSYSNVSLGRVLFVRTGVELARCLTKRGSLTT